MTTIQGKVINADGRPASGQVVISWPFFQVPGTDLVGGETTFKIVDGELSIPLQSNQDAQPLGMYYTATFELDSGQVYEEYWIVPNTNTATIGQCRASVPVSPSAIISPLQLGSLGALPNQFLQWNGTRWVPGNPTSLNFYPITIGMLLGSTGNDVNVVGSPVSLGSNIQLNIPDASVTARGVVTTGAQTFGGDKTFTGTTTIADLVVTGSVTPAPGSPGFPVTWAYNGPINGIVAGQRAKVNIYPGSSNVSVNMTDDPVGDQVLVVIDAIGGGNGGGMIDPTLAVGDLIVRGPTATERLPRGADGQILMTVSTSVSPLGVAWAAVGAIQTPWLSDIDAANHRLLNVAAIGIGTASPGTVLDVAGTIRSTAQTSPANGVGLELLYVAGQGYVIAYDRTANAARPLALGGSGGTIMILPSGNVGIGQAAPPAPLTIYSPTDYPYGGGVGMLQLQQYNNADYRLYMAMDASVNSGYIQAAGLNTGQTLLLNPLGGNVGIGTAAPTRPLQVSASIAVLGAVSTTDNAAVELDTPTGGTCYMQLLNDRWRVYVTAGERLTVNTTTGYVGVGVTTPSFPFQVYGGGTSWVARLSNNNVALDLGAQVDGTGPAINAPSWSLSLQTGGATRIYMGTDGRIGLGGVWRAASTAFMVSVSGGRALFAPNNEQFAIALAYNTSVSVNTYIGTNSAGDFCVSNAGGNPLMTLNQNSSGMAIWGNCNITGQYEVNGVPINTSGGPTYVWYGGFALNTAYYNGTGHPKWVTVSVYFAQTNQSAYARSDAGNPPGAQVARVSIPNSYWGDIKSMTFVVLPGHYYMVAADGGVQLDTWTEWY